VNTRSARYASVIVLLSLVLAACGGGPPGGSPSSNPQGGGALGARMPAQLGGQPMTYVEGTGDQVATLLESADATLLTESIDDVSKPMSALKVAVGVHPSVTVGALSVEGVHWTPGSSLLGRLVTALLGPTENLRITSQTISGKRLLHIRDFANEDYEAFAYISGQRDTDIAYFARGDAELVEEFFGAIR
jgi:hypothetical protein